MIDYYDDEYEEDEEEMLLHQCGLMDDGICMQAGTEHCDFDCPLRSELGKPLNSCPSQEKQDG